MATDPVNVFNDAELKRFAICFINCEKGNINWAEAAAQYDPNVKVESFRTVTLRALKKLDGDTGKGTPSSSKSPKRKAATKDNEDAESPVPKKKTAKGKGKKAGMDFEIDKGGELPMKKERNADDLEL